MGGAIVFKVIVNTCNVTIAVINRSNKMDSLDELLVSLCVLSYTIIALSIQVVSQINFKNAKNDDGGYVLFFGKDARKAHTRYY